MNSSLIAPIPTILLISSPTSTLSKPIHAHKIEYHILIWLKEFRRLSQAVCKLNHYGIYTNKKYEKYNVPKQYPLCLAL